MIFSMFEWMQVIKINEIIARVWVKTGYFIERTEYRYPNDDSKINVCKLETYEKTRFSE
jgi:hypothetical protein